MKVKSSLVLVLLVFAFSINAYAQETESAAESVDRMKLQLLEMQAVEADLRARLQELDESIKPENIERSLAGVGSTRPEELREARRRQLSIQRDGVRAQLQILEASRTRLENAIVNAEALAYQQSALPPDKEQTIVLRGLPAQWLIFGSGGLAVLALGGGGALLYRRNRRKMIS